MLPAFPVFFSWLPHFRSERDDLGELLVAQFAGYRPEDARSNRLVRIVNQYRRVIVKTDVRPVLAPLLFARAHNHAFHHRTLLHLAFRLRFFHRRRDDVAQSRRQPRISAQRKNAGQLPRAGIIRHRQPCSHLYHDLAPRVTAAAIQTRRNRRRFPTFASTSGLCGSWFQPRHSHRNSGQALAAEAPVLRFPCFTPRASSVAIFPSTASASISIAAASKQSAPCRLPSLRRSHRARSTSWCGALPGDRGGAAPRASPSPQSSSASSSKSRSRSVPAGLRAPPCSLALPLLLRSPLRLPQFSLAQHRLDPREIALRFPQLLQSFGLSGRKLKTQPENLLSQLALLGFKLGLAHLAVLHRATRVTFRHYSSSARLTNFVRMGSLCEASFIASVADARSTPAISNITRPGFTTATHFSGGPLPLPIRVSAGFFV